MIHDEMIAVIQAAKEGKTIESKPKFKSEDWNTSFTPGFNFNAYDYRVKREPREWHLSVNKSGTLFLSSVSPGSGLKPILVREVLED